ncbi:MAG: hydrogenase expression protein HypE, partial [Microvirga sp.]
MAPRIETLLAAGTTKACPPWPRAEVDGAAWQAAIDRLASGDWTLFGLWGDRVEVHMAVLDHGGAPGILSLACAGGGFPSVGARHAPAIRLERAIADLFGHHPISAPDTRRWLDHDRWGVRHPLGQAVATLADGAPYPFLGAEGPGLHQIPVGPVHAGIIEPGHFRFTANGETVVRLEARLGYTHKGIEGLMAGADLAQGGRLAGRVSGDSTVAYAYAYARAAEAALETEPPARAVWLRALMAEMERLANHFGDIGAICNDAAFAFAMAHCSVWREKVLRAAAACFGHRLMMDRVIPGGVTDLSNEGINAIRALIREIRARLPALVELYDRTTSLQDRTVGTGRLNAALARQFGAGGFIGRASGRNFDARRLAGPLPYGELDFQV